MSSSLNAKCPEIAPKSLARLRRAGLLSAEIFFGYSIGLFLVLYRIQATSTYYTAASWSRQDGKEYPQSPIVNALWMRCQTTFHDLSYGPGLELSRYPNYLYGGNETIHFSPLPWLQALLVIAPVVFAGIVVGRLAPIWFAPGGLGRGQSSVVSRRIWREKLQTLPPPKQKSLFLSAGAILGFSAAIFGESFALVFDGAAGRIALANNAPDPEPIRPIFALLAWPDAAWLLLGSFLLAAGSVIVTARDRLMRDKAMIAGWCFSCGYPRALPTSSADDAAASAPILCPECGKPPGAQKQRVGLRHARLAMAAILILSIVGYFAVPGILMAM